MYKVPILKHCQFQLNKELSVIFGYQWVQGYPGVPPNSWESNITNINGIIMVKHITSQHLGSKHNIHNHTANLLSKSSVSG